MVSNDMAELSVTLQVLVNGIMVGLLLALAAVGLSLVFGVMKVVNVAHGEFIMLSAYGTFWLYTWWGINPLLAFLPLVALAGLVGYLLYGGLLSRIMDRESLENDSLLITFGVSIILINVARLAWEPNRRSYQFLVGSYEFLGVRFGKSLLLAGAFAVALYLAVYLVLNRTQLGRAIRATAQNREQATRVGIDVRNIDAKTFVLASVLAASSGILLSMFRSITPNMGFEFVLDSFVVMILGGLGSFFGAFVGAILYSSVDHLGGHLFDITTGNILALSMVFVVLVFFPSGLFGTPGRRD
ncbi:MULTISPECIES: branched-chain amino acid ABC transporter permease [Salinibaculum]|uniref:branched-chain amino acid ABC transporter permease n=1 Tax=Salinibaculum TaxID=2732368 RepID=UPI0030CC4D2E